METVFPIASASGGSIHTPSPQEANSFFKMAALFSVSVGLVKILAKPSGEHLLIHIFAGINQ